MIQSVKEANSIEELDIVRARVDAAVERVAAGATSGSLDAEKTGMVALAVHYLDDIIAERRNQLKGEAQRSRDSTHTRTVSQ